MRDYAGNARRLIWFAPFRTMSISAAYLVPFFLEKGLSMAGIMALQSVFTAACALWELPSGYLADRFGRARVIRLHAPLAAATLVAYGLSSHYWQFVVCEMLLALTTGLYSGADKALLYDSLHAGSGLQGGALEQAVTRQAQHVRTAGFAGVVLAVPVSLAIVPWFGVSAAIVADGLLLAAGIWTIRHLAEAPRQDTPDDRDTIPAGTARRRSWIAARRYLTAIAGLLANPQARWLLVLTTALSTATYVGFWASAPYYQAIGIPLAAFAAVAALRNLVKALLSHYCGNRSLHRRREWAFAGLAGTGFLAMASGQPWLAWAVLGHDAVHALQSEPVSARLNRLMPSGYRATLNSVESLLGRLVLTVAGPAAGWLLDHAGQRCGFTVLAVVFMTVASLAVLRLHHHKAFGESAERR